MHDRNKFLPWVGFEPTTSWSTVSILPLSYHCSLIGCNVSIVLHSVVGSNVSIVLHGMIGCNDSIVLPGVIGCNVKIF